MCGRRQEGCYQRFILHIRVILQRPEAATVRVWPSMHCEAVIPATGASLTGVTVMVNGGFRGIRQPIVRHIGEAVRAMIIQRRGVGQIGRGESQVSNTIGWLADDTEGQIRTLNIATG